MIRPRSKRYLGDWSLAQQRGKSALSIGFPEGGIAIGPQIAIANVTPRVWPTKRKWLPTWLDGSWTQCPSVTIEFKKSAQRKLNKPYGLDKSQNSRILFYEKTSTNKCTYLYVCLT